MNRDAIVTGVVDPLTRYRAAQWLRQVGAKLPRFGELADTSIIPHSRIAALGAVDPDRPDPANLFRVHWYNDRNLGGFASVLPHLVLPPELTGVASPIVVALGCFFPMIGAHKVLAAYGCFIPYLVTGRFDPAATRRSGRRPEIIAVAGSPFPASSAVAGLPCCRPG